MFLFKDYSGVFSCILLCLYHVFMNYVWSNIALGNVLSNIKIHISMFVQDILLSTRH